MIMLMKIKLNIIKIIMLSLPYIAIYSRSSIQNINNRRQKTNVLLNLIENQPDTDEIYLYVKDPYEAKYQYLINKKKNVWT